MSLINKMLQDLDARGTPAGQSFPSSVKPVAPERRAPSLRLVGAGVGGALAVLALAWFGWQHFHAGRPAHPAAAPLTAKPAPSTPIASKAARGMGGTIAPVTAASPVAAKIAPPGAVEPQALAPAAAPARTREPQADEEAETAVAPTQAKHARTHARAQARGLEAAPAPATVAVRSKSVPPMEPDSVEARAARRAAAIELATRGARMSRLARLSARQAPAAGVQNKTKGRIEPEGVQEAPAQRAEDAYRRALASLQEGRMIEAIASLQAALRADPGHDAARQTLVGLLVEAGRTDEAMRELQLGLAQDPRQPALAMLLARLQIEHGGSGIETLQRSLPYAGNDPEYHAFLAGALQRQQRHREAVDQYQQALRAAPGNGVWWMGLGISLEADKRKAEALDAFQKARASGSLNEELQGFVERRLQQLGR